MKGTKILKRFYAKPILFFALTLSFLPFFADNASAVHDQIKAGWAANGIASSMHNLSSTGSWIANGKIGYTVTSGAFDRDAKLAGTSEMCVYCHTPHFADRGKGPLWNRIFSGGTVENYGTTIAKNNDSAGNSNMFSTIACLSCHDGVTTFDNIINQPGMDLDNVEALTGNGVTNSKRWLFRMGQSVNGTVDTDHFGSTTADHGGVGSCDGCHGNGNGIDDDEPTMFPYFDSGYKRLIIGEQDSPGFTGKTNLTNDHPIGVLYRGNGDASASASLRARTVLISSVVMAVAKGDRGVVSPAPAATDAAALASGGYFAALVTGNLWAVKGFISDSATIQDLLRSGSGNTVEISN